MRRSALALLLALLAAPAAAQVPFPAGAENQSNLALIGVTAPTLDSSNKLATTQWVNNLVNAGLPLASGKIWIGSVGNIATAQTPSGDLTVSNAGVFTFGTVNASPGTFGSVTQCAAVTVNGKGLVTTATQSTCTPAIANVTGLGTGVAAALAINIGSAGAPVLFNGAGGTPSSLVGTNITGTAAGLTAGNVTTNANLTGPVTSVGNATTIGANQVSRANEAQGIARSVIGVTGNATANVADIQGAANQFLGVNSAGTALLFQSIPTNTNFPMGAGVAAAFGPGVTNFAGFSAICGAGAESGCYVPVSAPGTFKNMYVNSSSSPGGADTYTFTFRSGASGALSDSTITCTITGAAKACSDLTHSVAVTAGQMATVKMVSSATAASATGIAFTLTVVTTSP